MRAYAVLVLLAAACIAVSATELPSSVSTTLFPGRSAPIVLQPREADEWDALAIVIDKSQHQLHGARAETELPITSLADVATRTLGVRPLHRASSLSFVKSNPFHKVRAHVSIAVQAAGEELLASHQMNHLQHLRNEHHSFKLTGHVYPASPVAMAASLATGAAPSEHGIVGDGWFNAQGQKVAAFSSAAAASVRANVADVLSQSFSGRSLTVSASANAASALAHAVHYSLRALHPSWNNLVFANSQGSAFASLVPEHHRDLELSLARIHSLLASDALASFVGASTVSFNQDSREITVSINNVHSTFSIDSQPAVAFFGELLFVENLLATLERNPAFAAMVADEFPDLFTFTFSGLRAIRASFGEDSTQMHAAVGLLDVAIPEIINRFAALYHDSLVAQVVVMGSERTAIEASVAEKIKQIAPQVLDDFFPALYVRSDANPATICSTLSSKLHGADVSVHCVATSPLFIQLSSNTLMSNTLSSLLGANASNSTNGTITDDDIQIYQICLWTGVLLAASIFAAIYLLASMSFRREPSARFTAVKSK